MTPEAHFLVLSGNPAETTARYGVEAFHANDPVARLDAVERSRLVIIGGGGLLHDYWGVPAGTLFAAGTWGMSLFVTIALFAALRRVPVMLWASGHCCPRMAAQPHELFAGWPTSSPSATPIPAGNWRP